MIHWVRDSQIQNKEAEKTNMKRKKNITSRKVEKVRCELAYTLILGNYWKFGGSRLRLCSNHKFSDVLYAPRNVASPVVNSEAGTSIV